MDVIAEAVELIRNATCPGDYDQAWELVGKATEDRETAAERGFALVRSPDPAERKIGCDLLGNVAQVEESVRERVLLAVLELIATETEPAVHASIARTLGCTGDERAVPELLRLAEHADEDVRFYVAWSLPLGCEDDDAVIEALIRLTADPEDEVRDWATFALGTQCQADGSAIREALWARVGDQDTEAREEAIAGLARRRDRRVVPHAARLLDDGGFSPNTLTAIACLGDPALVPYLEDFEEDEGIAAALGECDPASRAARDAFAAGLAEALHARMPELDFGVYGEICEPGLTLAACGDKYHWSIERLRDRVSGDPVRAAELVAEGLPQTGSPGAAA
ncbi:HEAT repeat domain-containing protein [Nonomuraea sp. NPDC050451]|uniref:HEAT repeat domain-containing protein n=1 Tax=Nonomuraea sp. NPDC050451 TaxID=3364364 RepID=UPI00378CB4F7